MQKITLLFVLLFLCAGVLFGQSPGGVTGVEVWMKTTPLSDNRQGNYYWKDYAGDSVSLRPYDSKGAVNGPEFTQIRSKVRTYNFNPGMDLADPGTGVHLLLKRTSLAQSTLFGIYGANDRFDKETELYGINGRPGKGLRLTNDNIRHSNESGKADLDYGTEEGTDLIYKQGSEREPNLNTFKERALRIVSQYRSITPSANIWGESKKDVITFGYAYDKNDPNNTSTYSIPAENNQAFWGKTPEFIIYNRFLTPLERRKVESYMAFKYGVSLDYSYISSTDKLIWDAIENAGYNYRITGYGRDDRSGFFQVNSTTSYEEASYFAVIGGVYDSFDNNDSYQKSSRYRLLTIGRSEANDMLQDEQYIIYGDDDLPIETYERDDYAGLKFMKRSWLLQTNIPAPPMESVNVLEWNSNGIIFQPVDSFKYNVSKDPNITQGMAFTSIPLKGKSGYLACTPTNVTGPFNITFHTGGIQHFGYHFGSNGYIYKIINGEVVKPQFGMISANTRVEVVKNGDVIYLLENGVNNHHEIYLDKANTDADYYGGVLIDPGNSYLTNFRHGGFTDKTGDKVELSYIAQRASEFKDKQNYLVVDRSGTGKFLSDNTSFYRSDETDANRSKIIFNNVFWDTDSSSKDVFTFAYKTSGIIAEIEKFNPLCEDGIPLDNGKLYINIKEGIKGFYYWLKDINTNTDIKSGAFHTDTLTINDIPSGTYDLTLLEIGGYNFTKKDKTGPVAQASSSSYFTSTTNAYLEWIVTGNNTDAIVAMMTTTSTSVTPNNISFDYGVKINGLDLHIIEKGVVETTPFATITGGQRVTIERIGYTLYYKVDNQEVLRRTIQTADRSKRNFGVVSIANGNVYNMKWNRMATTTGWNITSNTLSEKSFEDKVVKRIAFDAPCYSEDKAITEGDISLTKTGNLLFAYQKESYSGSISVYLETDDTQVTFVVFDLNGNMVDKKTITNYSSKQEVTLTTGKTGMSIVKALTSGGEYSKKVLTN